MTGAALYAVPRGVEAQHLLAIEDDPGQIADRALEGHFDSDIATREVESALAASDADLARSFVELARERNVTIDPALSVKVDAAVAQEESAQHAMQSFAMGFVTGEPNDASSLAGTAVGDLFVFGDIRDAVREGGRMALGQPADELVLGLAGVGLAITAATYATLGEAAPARIGVSLAKAARKTGALSADLAAYMGRTLRQVVEWNRLKAAMAGASISEPAVAIRAAREAVKVERAGGLLHLVRDVGRVQSKAGTKAALEGLKVAETPREMSRFARLAAEKGGKTRAIIKLVGRGAIILTVAAFDLGLWILGALFALFGVVSSLKSTTERMTLRLIRRAKERRLAAEQRRFAALTQRG
ncbi:MAG: hypothetical protein JO205_11080 [Pseudolabrys sp.]|nr:hypothetical protein [Pseudolabrys sp.]MBV9261903.1 hypothetical protein [Pseudolabrys sp.]